jgi:hypothetical protein
MQLCASRLSRGVWFAALVAAAPMALAGVQSDIKTNPLPVDQVLGRASGEAFFETRPEASAPHALTSTFDKAVRFLTQPPNPATPDRFGRGGGNLPASG